MLDTRVVTFYRLAIPVTLQVLFMSARNIADIFMTAKLGTVAVASVGIAGKAIMVGMVALGGLASGSSVLGAQFVGEQNYAGLRRSSWLGMVSSLLVVLPILVLFTQGAPALVALATDDPLVIRAASQYLSIFSLSFIFLTLNTVLGISLRVSGHASKATYVSLVGVLLNIVIGYGLILGHWSLPKLGINGAAWATLISSAIELVLLISLLVLRLNWLLPRLADLPMISRPAILSYLSISIPSTINGLLWAVGIFIYSMIYGRMGTAALAIMASLTPLESIAASIEQGLATATAILLGKHLGRFDFAEARANSTRYLKYGMATSLSLGLTMLAAMPLFLQLFYLDGPNGMLAVQVYVVMVLTFWVKTINAVGISGILRSGGDIGAGLRIDIIGQWAIGIPLALMGAFVLKLSLPLVFLLVMLEEVSKAFLTLSRIRQYVWLRKITS